MLRRFPIEILKELKSYLSCGDLILSYLDERMPKIEVQQRHLNQFASSGYLAHLLYFLEISPEYHISFYAESLVESGSEECIRYVVTNNLHEGKLIELPGSLTPEFYDEMLKEGLLGANIEDVASNGNLSLFKHVLAKPYYVGSMRNAFRQSLINLRVGIIEYLLKEHFQAIWIEELGELRGSIPEVEPIIGLLLTRFSKEELGQRLTCPASLYVLAKLGWKPEHDALHLCWTGDSLPLVRLMLAQGEQFEECCIDSHESDDPCTSIELMEIVLRHSSELLTYEFYSGVDNNVRAWIAENYPEKTFELLKSELDFECSSTKKNRNTELFFAYTPRQLDLILDYRCKLGPKPFLNAWHALTGKQRRAYFEHRNAEEILDLLSQ